MLQTRDTLYSYFLMIYVLWNVISTITFRFVTRFLCCDDVQQSHENRVVNTCLLTYLEYPGNII